MRKIYTTVAILLCLGYMGFAQNLTFSVTPSEVQANPGETVQIDFNIVDGFDDILAMEFQLNWDTDALEYVSKGDITTELPSFMESSVGDAEIFISDGFVKISWFDFSTFQAYSLPDSTRLFSLTFMAKEEGNSAFSLSNVEIGDANEQAVTADLEANTVTIGAGGGGGVELNEDPVEIGIGDGSGSEGDQVCLPVRVANFENMETIQFSINYDESLLAFQAAENINLNSLTAGNISSPDAGEIIFSWNANGDSISVANNTRIFDLCFDVLGTENTTTDVDITSTPRSIEAMRASVGEVGITETNGTVTITADDGGGGTSENFRIYGEELSVAPGETVCMDIKVDGFADIAGLQSSMSWNTNVIQYVEARNLNNNLNGFTQESINEDNGTFRFQWSDFTFTGVTLPDESVIFQLCFEAVGDAGQSSAVSFTNSPIQQEVLNTDTELLPFTGVDGRINIAGDPPPPSDCDENATPFCLSDEMVDVGQQACVRVNAQNFDDIASMQFTIVFDESILTFDTIIPLVDGDFGSGIVYNANNSAGIISFQWSDVNASNLSFEDGTALFDFCFTGEAEGISEVGFSNTPTAIEVGDIDFNFKEFNPGTGQIEVKGSGECSTPNVSGDVNNVLCAGEASGAIGLTVVGGNSNFNYEWDGPTPIPVGSPNATDLLAGEYFVTVTSNVEGCDLTTETSF
ncbi:MAG: cohesin domain-containing protein, partial [Bacteroidota bacterium]